MKLTKTFVNEKRGYISHPSKLEAMVSWDRVELMGENYINIEVYLREEYTICFDGFDKYFKEGVELPIMHYNSLVEVSTAIYLVMTDYDSLKTKYVVSSGDSLVYYNKIGIAEEIVSQLIERISFKSNEPKLRRLSMSAFEKYLGDNGFYNDFWRYQENRYAQLMGNGTISKMSSLAAFNLVMEYVTVMDEQYEMIEENERV